MSSEQMRKNVQGFFASNFTGVEASNIAWDNVNFQIPTTPWIRFGIQNTVANQVSTGGPSIKIRRGAIVFFQIFVPRGETTLVADNLADQIINVLECVSLSTGETFRAASKTEVGITDDWYQLNVSIPFYYDDQRSI
jgi:hypothetical protein